MRTGIKIGVMALQNAYRTDSYVRRCDTLCTFQTYKTLLSDQLF